MSAFDQAFALVIGHEGGFTDNEADPGTWTGGRCGVGECRGTNWGISAAAYPRLDIRNLTIERAKAIYQTESAFAAMICRRRSRCCCSMGGQRRSWPRGDAAASGARRGAGWRARAGHAGGGAQGCARGRAVPRVPGAAAGVHGRPAGVAELRARLGAPALHLVPIRQSKCAADSDGYWRSPDGRCQGRGGASGAGCSATPADRPLLPWRMR
jgi:hypothetical protein